MQGAIRAQVCAIQAQCYPMGGWFQKYYDTDPQIKMLTFFWVLLTYLNTILKYSLRRQTHTVIWEWYGQLICPPSKSKQLLLGKASIELPMSTENLIQNLLGLASTAGPWLFPLRAEVLPTPAVQQLIGCNPVFHHISSIPSSITTDWLTAPFFDQSSLCIASQQEKQGSPQVYQMTVLCQRSSLVFPHMTGKFICSDTNQHGGCPVSSFLCYP